MYFKFRYLIYLQQDIHQKASNRKDKCDTVIVIMKAIIFNTIDLTISIHTLPCVSPTCKGVFGIAF